MNCIIEVVGSAFKKMFSSEREQNLIYYFTKILQCYYNITKVRRMDNLLELTTRLNENILLHSKTCIPEFSTNEKNVCYIKPVNAKLEIRFIQNGKHLKVSYYRINKNKVENMIREDTFPNMFL